MLHFVISPSRPHNPISAALHNSKQSPNSDGSNYLLLSNGCRRLAIVNLYLVFLSPFVLFPLLFIYILFQSCYVAGRLSRNPLIRFHVAGLLHLSPFRFDTSFSIQYASPRLDPHYLNILASSIPPPAHS